MSGLPETPSPPGYELAWDDLDAVLEWVQAMRGCPQDPEFHAEGDVWIHTRMVAESLAALPRWRKLAAGERALLFAAALLHDVAKPRCTRVEGGRVRSPGHSRRGAAMTRRILWEAGAPLAVREHVASLVLHHQVPFWLLERDDPRRLAIRISTSTRCAWLALLAEADARGRVCADQERLLEHIALFAELCREEGCLERRWPFPSDHTRFVYFRSGGRRPEDEVYDDTQTEVVLMSGLPGAGKDAWLTTHLPGWPRISLDDLRDELDVDPRDRQGRVVQEARARAREQLRAGRPFVVNATNLSRRIRGGWIDLCASYRARIRIVYVDAAADELRTQNRERPRPVPEAVIRRLLDRWEVPDLTEAHQVDWVRADGTDLSALPDATDG